jgi:hypothetical protein
MNEIPVKSPKEKLPDAWYKVKGGRPKFLKKPARPRGWPAFLVLHSKAVMKTLGGINCASGKTLALQATKIPSNQSKWRTGFCLCGSS